MCFSLKQQLNSKQKQQVFLSSTFLVNQHFITTLPIQSRQFSKTCIYILSRNNSHQNVCQRPHLLVLGYVDDLGTSTQRTRNVQKLGLPRPLYAHSTFRFVFALSIAYALGVWS